ncbi:MAG TPA: SCO family protein [Pyrinomonadaceae bacterium]|jgi:cytochrome oxidase Cu insertion factor (SCO1/SenC/PrrC family)|nr:SCO family protein [Pyrinomonadaceae bacterium]
MNNSRKLAFALVALIVFVLAPAMSGASTTHARHNHSHEHAATATAQSPRRQQPQQRAAVTYVCPMHADVTSSKPGRCPECGMDLKVLKKAEAAPPATENAAAPAPKLETSPVGALGDKSVAGDKSAGAGYFPNHILLTQDNKPVRFYEDMIKGKVVLINFMFTTCAGVCPPMAANMAKVQSYLGDRVGKDVVMISISVDPTVDTPDKLKKYADNFKAKPGWYFLTGKKENVDWVLYKLGGYAPDKMQHSAVLIIGNEATGQWIKTAALRNPAQIAEAVIDLLATDKK